MGATGKDLHVNVPLSNVAIQYTPTGMIAEQIAPIVTVGKQSDSYNIWSLADAYRIEEDKRAPATEANVIERSVSSDTYFAKNYALKDKIPYEDLKNADAAFVMTERGSRVKYIKNKLYLNWEYRVGLQCTSTSNIGSSSAVASNWSDEATGNSNPMDDLTTAMLNIEGVTGYMPNRAIFGRVAWKHFRNHADVIDRLYGNQTGPTGRIISVQQAANLLELDQVYIGRAKYNSANEGQTASLTDIWGANVLLYYAPMNPSKEEPSFMYSFRWPVVTNMQAEVFQLPRAKAEEVQLGYYQDEKITASTLGFLITDVASSV